MHGEPLPVQGRVRSLHDGVFNEDQIRHGAQGRFDMGKTAVVESESLTCWCTRGGRRLSALNQLTSCGIEPRKFAVLVAKGVNAPIAAYSPLCRTFIRVDTPGVTTANMTRLPFNTGGAHYFLSRSCDVRNGLLQAQRKSCFGHRRGRIVSAGKLRAHWDRPEPRYIWPAETSTTCGNLPISSRKKDSMLKYFAWTRKRKHQFGKRSNLSCAARASSCQEVLSFNTHYRSCDGNTIRRFE